MNVTITSWRRPLCTGNANEWLLCTQNSVNQRRGALGHVDVGIEWAVLVQHFHRHSHLQAKFVSEGASAEKVGDGPTRCLGRMFHIQRPCLIPSLKQSLHSLASSQVNDVSFCSNQSAPLCLVTLG